MFTGERNHATEHAVVTTPKVFDSAAVLLADLLNLNRFATGQVNPACLSCSRKCFYRFLRWKLNNKIAECLSSVDELMAVQARKVDALKAHKGG